MPVFGLDISHHQDLGLDLAQCRREGIEFVFLKATEGATFVDSEFAKNLAEAREAGQLVAAYHYVRSNVGAAAQVAHIQTVIPKNVPVIPDVEANSGAIGLTRDFIARLRAAGYRVPLLYLPRWYWQQIGSPSLAGLPPLWSSRYPDNVVGTIADEWAHVPASYWNGYGGLDVAVLQFTSSARIAGHAPLDANAYRGTRAQLAALLGGAAVPAVPPLDEEDPMRFVRGDSKTPIAGTGNVSGDVVFKVVWGENGATAVRTRITNPADPGYVTALKTGAGMDPATKQPWVLPQTVVDAIPDAKSAAVSVDLAPVIAFLTANPPTAVVGPSVVNDIAIAAAVATVAELKKEGN